MRCCGAGMPTDPVKILVRTSLPWVAVSRSKEALDYCKIRDDYLIVSYPDERSVHLCSALPEYDCQPASNPNDPNTPFPHVDAIPYQSEPHCKMLACVISLK
jgi:hypothetical protein